MLGSPGRKREKGKAPPAPLLLSRQGSYAVPPRRTRRDPPGSVRTFPPSFLPGLPLACRLGPSAGGRSPWRSWRTRKRPPIPEVAAALGLHLGTVHAHLRRIYLKLGVFDRISAALRGLGFGLISLDA